MTENADRSSGPASTDHSFESASDFESGEGKRGSTRLPANHSVKRSASRPSARVPSLPTSSRSCSSTSALSRWRQPPTMRPSHHAVGPALPVESTSCGLSDRGTSLARSNPSWSGRAAAAGPPTARPLRCHRRHRPTRIRPPVEVDFDGTDLGQPAPHGLHGRSEPPLDVGDGARTECAQPVPDQRRNRLGLRDRGDRTPEPRLHRRPARSRHVPRTVVRRPHDEASAPRAPSARAGRPPQSHPTTSPRRTRFLRPASASRRATRTRSPAGRRTARRALASTPVTTNARLRPKTGLLDLADQAPLFVGGDPVARRRLRDRKGVAREEEHGAAHGQVLDQRALFVQGALDVTDARPPTRAQRGHEDRGGIGPCRHTMLSAASTTSPRPMTRRQTVPPREPGPTFGNPDRPHDSCQLRSVLWSSRCSGRFPEPCLRLLGRSQTSTI